MTDIVICHSPDDRALVGQLADAIARQGYDAALHDSPSDAITSEIAEAKAAIIVWSEAAAASEWIRAEANVARGLRKLIQVSADGRPPPVPFDRAQTISILTWKGEEDHPAWRNVRDALIALCGPPPERTAPAAPVAAPDPPPAPAAPVEPRPIAPPAGGPNPLMIVLIVGLVLAALAAGAWYWMQSRAPEAVADANEAAQSPQSDEPRIVVPETSAPAEAPPPPPAAFDLEAVVRDPAGAAVLRNAPSTLGLAIARVETGQRVATYAQSGEWWQVRTASGQTGFIAASSLSLRGAPTAQVEPGQPGQAVRPSRPERRAEPARPRGQRIRKENAEVMIQYCDGAGRGTPQCRRFSRQLGN